MQVPQLRWLLTEAFSSALRAVEPVLAVRDSLQRVGSRLSLGGEAVDLGGSVRLVAVGKAAHGMILGALSVVGDLVVEGVAVGPAPSRPTTDRVRWISGNHPRPDSSSVIAGKAMMDLASRSEPSDLLICLISGGGSAMAELPEDGLSIHDLISTQDALMAVGTPIGELNTVRRHLSKLKNGGLAAAANQTQLITLLISDVGDQPASTVASGPTLPDATTADDALRTVRRRLGTTASQKVVASLQSRSADRHESPSHPWQVIADGRKAAEAALSFVEATGVPGQILTTSLSGEARIRAVELQRASFQGVTILTGETTVTGAVEGRGGRNQEAALGAALAMEGIDGWAMACLGTDGVDGPTDAAGAIVDGGTIKRGSTCGIDAREALSTHNSYNFLEASGDLVRTGPTGTNVGDLWLLVHSDPAKT